MLHFPKDKIILALVVSILILFAFMFLATKNIITNVSAVEASGVGVYWDSNCNNRVFSIYWGNLTLGSVKNIIIYIRNEVEEPVYLFMSTTNWNPSKASKFLNLGWNYSGKRINPEETLRITLTLSVSYYVGGISNFSFDIIIFVSQNFLGDTNGDGVVDIFDLIIVGVAFGSKQGDPNWNPNADVNGDNIVDVYDIIIVGTNYGKTA